MRARPKAEPKPAAVVAVPRLRRPDAQPGAGIASDPVATISSSNGPTTTMILGGIGLVLALLAVGISLVPAWSVPVSVGVRLERNRQTIAVTGLAIGLACGLVGLLTVLSGA